MTLNDEPRHGAFAFVIPWERFVYRRDGRWLVTEPIGKEGITNHLLESGMAPDEVKAMLQSRSYNKVYGVEIVPGVGHFHEEGGRWYLNTWVEPRVVATPGEYPRIERILDFLTDGDAAGAEWLAHWLALKVQNPAIVPRVAAVFTTKPGSGKGTLAKILSLLLGPENCATIEGSALESRFNARWADKLFVLADEVLTSESVKDVSNRLKVLIDAEHIELEGKGENQRAVRNRLAWMFASNDDVAPVVLEVGDRRYSVFSNHSPVPDEYKQMLKDAWEDDGATPTASFAAEISAFYHDLLELEVDRRLVSSPYDNAARDELIEANLPSHRLFFRYVDDVGVDALLDRVVTQGDWSLSRTRPEWDFGADGLATNIIYQCYVLFCRDAGAKALKLNKFGSAVKKHGWRPVRGGTKRNHGYAVRRNTTTTPAPAGRVLPFTGTPATTPTTAPSA